MVMMGGLHIAMDSSKMAGQWLNNSGWDSALVQADVTTLGRADAILKAAMSPYAHQVSACTLYIVQRQGRYRWQSGSSRFYFLVQVCEINRLSPPPIVIVM